VDVAGVPQTVGLCSEKGIVGIVRAEGDGSHTIETVDFCPMAAAVSGAVKPAETVGGTTPTTENAHIPGVLQRVRRVYNDVFGPIKHSWIGYIGPSLSTWIVDEHTRASGEGGRTMA